MDKKAVLVDKLSKMSKLKNPMVQVNGDEVTIGGETRTWYDKQLAQEAAIQMRCWRVIKNKVVVT